MAHVRQQIRTALESALTGLAGVNAVYVGRRPAIDAMALPALVLLANPEAVARLSKGGQQMRTLTVDIEAHAQQAAGILDAFDALALEIETAVAGAAALAALTSSVDLVGTEYDYNVDAIQPAGLVRLTYEITYHTDQAAPDVPL